MTRPSPSVVSPSTLIRSGHPHAQGLVGAWLMNAGGGQVIANLLNPADMAVTQTIATGKVTGSWGESIAGPGLNITAPGQCAYVAAPSAALQPADKVSTYWRGVLQSNGNTTNNPSMVGMWYDNANGSPFVCYGLHRTSSAPSSLSFFANSAGTFFSFAYGTAVDASAYGKRVVDYLSTYDRSVEHRLYRNGVLVGSNAAAKAAISYSATSNLNMGSHVTSPDTMGAAMQVVYIWNRVVTPSEAWELNADPFAMVQSAALLSQLAGMKGASASGVFGPWRALMGVGL